MGFRTELWTELGRFAGWGAALALVAAGAGLMLAALGAGGRGVRRG